MEQCHNYMALDNVKDETIMKRVVGYKRFSPKERKAQIYNCVSNLSATKGFATITDIARSLEMTPSTHLKKMALSLVIEDMIDLSMKSGPFRVEVYHFYIGVERLTNIVRKCAAPWDCFDSDTNVFDCGCKIKINGIEVNCPAHDANRAIRRMKAKWEQSDEVMQWAGDENGYIFAE